MGKLSNYAENKVLDHVLMNDAYPRPDALFIALATAQVIDADTGGSISEISGGDYTRISADSWDAAANRATTNSTVMSFPTPSADWGVAFGWAILDTATLLTGNIVAYGDFSPAKKILSGVAVNIDKGQLDISYNKAGSSDYLANAMLDHLFPDTPFTQPASIYMGFATGSIADTDTGSTVGEPSAGYARTLENDWDASVDGESSNADEFKSESATADWGDILYWLQADALTTGNILFYGEFVSAVSVDSGYYLKLAANDIKITLA